ncbi:hypothetical protein [Thermococcus sp. LS1]|uniref:SLOG cluster 4 domain-containing protein n=1 Tax=Thermococcus sp. LS1 TaxID=1638259 RepID=UPI001F0F3012|nr:hypothetical protein [Thermococcus sp. LS1]
MSSLRPRGSWVFMKTLHTDVVLLMGDKGVMRVVSEDFRRRGGTVVGILSYLEESNGSNSVGIKIGLDRSAGASSW